MSSRLHELRQALGKATDELETLIDDPDAFKEKEDEIKLIEGRIALAEKSQAAQRALAQRASTGAADKGELSFVGLEGLTHKMAMQGVMERFAKIRSPEKHFGSLGEQLAAIARHYLGNGTDARLVRAPAGAGETDPSAGGFLVQTDFIANILMRIYDEGELLKRAFKLPISTNANSIKIPAIDESSRATGSRFGGVQSFWAAEGDSVTQTKPKFRTINLDLKKLFSTWVVTDEILEDAAALTGVANEAFTQEIIFMTEDAIFEGSGAGQPAGIMKSPSLVTVAAEKGQATKTIIWPNIVAMEAQMWGRSFKNAAWLINVACKPQLNQMNQAAGTGGLPVYLPNGTLGSSATGNLQATLLGLPVIPIEYANDLGTSGDIVLADLSQYLLADKGGMKMMSSMHVRFLTDEMTFRLTYRVDGQPAWHTSLTPFKGSKPLSPFVALASR
jgi:HK97 family phage major capsid protein